MLLTAAVAVGLLGVQLFGAGPFFSFDSARDCNALVPRDGHDLAADPVEAVVGVSRSAFPCAAEVTVAAVGDPAAVRTGARHAVEAGGPLLLVSDGLDQAVADELARLEPEKVTVVGGSEGLRASVAELAAEVGGLDVDSAALSPSAGKKGAGPVFLVDGEIISALPAIEVVAAATEGTVVVAEDVELTSMPDPMRLVIEQASALRLVGGFDPSTAWQVELLRSDAELPGGGKQLFPGRRLVGFYGSPLTTQLGVLGEQDADQTLERMRSALIGYDADGTPVVPVFEIIATVASAGAGPDGDYSDELSIDTLRPWVNLAARQGVYVVLDLQPGRADFLTQAQRYEELLRMPHVGLALDPEWRLGSDQVHLEQIGTVDTSEINRVSEWLAGIVQEEVLPQKLLLLHQFRESMITNRNLLATPPELATVIQMDGQGTLPVKYDSWDALTAGWTPESGYLWGWKNFYDEDTPMATPSEVLGLSPVPVFISFQ